MGLFSFGTLLADAQNLPDPDWISWALIGLFIVVLGIAFTCVRFIPNNRVGIVEKLWGPKSLAEGHLIALEGEAGYQADLLRGGLHFGFWRWQYRIHQVPLVTIPQGKIGYIYARDGEPLLPSQTLGRVVASNNFQDARAFLGGAREDFTSGGQRGRQRAILREGVYAVNLALFTIITEDVVYRLNFGGQKELETVMTWQKELGQVDGFSPVVIGAPVQMRDPVNPDQQLTVDSIGIVTVHDGPSLSPGEIIAPGVGKNPSEPNYHNNYQDAEAFLAAGGRRGRQYVALTDGTYFINRWFATVELIPKTVVPIGYVGVIVSYYGRFGRDVSGDTFRHGERVTEGERGVWERPLGPGKYPFNTYAGNLILVPTTNFVLHWITGRSEAHRYDESLRSIDLVTKDAYEPLLPLSVVVHIDYQKAPSVIQRFGDIKKLITQTLDPMLSAYFRDVAHKKTMLQLLQERDNIQSEAREELRRKFREFDIECVDVLIGKPDTAEAGGKIETLLEQLRQRQLSIEQIETYERQRAASEKLQVLNEAKARADMQTELTQSRVHVQIAENEGDADLARARKQAEQMVVTAQAESQQRVLAGRGEGSRVMQVGLAEASVLLRKIGSFGDPRLYALSLVAEHLANSSQPLVPERLFMASSNGENGHTSSHSQGLLGMLIDLLVAEKSGFELSDASGTASLHEYAERMTREVMQSMEQAAMEAKPMVPSTPPASVALASASDQPADEDPVFTVTTQE
ncbi:MAG TPA: SPFH domain-containing protein [Gemmataceae bacterium]|nr:SPFH domain-containing protein [Gemmataceae bacterium]